MSDEGARRWRLLERDEEATGMVRRIIWTSGRAKRNCYGEKQRRVLSATGARVTCSGQAAPRFCSLAPLLETAPTSPAQAAATMLSALRLTAQVARPWSASSMLQRTLAPSCARSALPQFSLCRSFHPSLPAAATLNQATRRKHKKNAKASKSPLLEGNTQKKGVVSQVFIAKPKKPNSAKRKVARVKLSTGKTVQAYVPGEGHNLQDHSVVLIRGGRTQDLPGVRCVLNV